MGIEEGWVPNLVFSAADLEESTETNFIGRNSRERHQAQEHRYAITPFSEAKENLGGRNKHTNQKIKYEGVWCRIEVRYRGCQPLGEEMLHVAQCLIAHGFN